MDYFILLNLKKEPFSNSPDPELFYSSFQHRNCLQKLELALRLRRGLSVVIGNIGTGKSTLSRQLVRMVGKDDSKIRPYLLLDPEFTSAKEFLRTIGKTFGVPSNPEDSEWQMKEDIKTHLFQQGVDLQLVPVLIIDEGQKIPDFCIEILREFLNYETNQHKLLQIIIFAQEEFQAVLKRKANFADRITTLQRLTSLSFSDTRKMIRFRIEKCRRNPAGKLRLFSPAALLAIYLLSGGYPRKIVMLCSKIILNMLVKNKKRAGLFLVFAAVRETFIPSAGRYKRVAGTLIVLMAATASLFLKFDQNSVSPISERKLVQKTSATMGIVPIPGNTITTAVPKPDLPKENLVQSVLPTEPEIRKKETEFQPLDHIESVRESEERILGTLAIQRGDSLNKIISRVYGSFNLNRLEAVLALNPHINNPERIIAGAEITLPALNKPIQLESGQIIIQLAPRQSLQDAYLLFTGYPDSAPHLLMLPNWEENGKVSFSLIVAELFSNEQQAQNTLDSLPERYKESAMLIPRKP
jgi:general secretion pathway protein A